MPHLTSPDLQALDLKAQGNDAFNAKDYEKAVDFFTQAIALFPNDYTFYSNRFVLVSTLATLADLLVKVHYAYEFGSQ
jgi:Flp pilus assembly protein TadD